MPKQYTAGLSTGSTGNTYLSSRWSLLGRVFSKTLNSQLVYGPALTQFIDTQTLLGFIPTYGYFVPSQNLLFVLGPASATPTVALS